MAGAYKERGGILSYSMGFLVILMLIVFAYSCILGWATIGKGNPQIAWYITGGLVQFPVAAGTTFTATFMLGEYSPAMYRDPALISFIMGLGAIAPEIFGIWWYWDLGVRCQQSGVKSIELPMCTSSVSGQVMIVWSMAAVFTLYGIWNLIYVPLSFADLYFRRLKGVTKSTIDTAKKISPSKILGGSNPLSGAGRDIPYEEESEPLQPPGELPGTEDIYAQLGLPKYNGSIVVKSKKRVKRRRPKTKNR